MKTRKQQTGFTLVELIITLVVVGILVAVATPSFRNYMVNSRLTTTTNNFVTAIAFARSEAVKRSAPVRIVAIAPTAANEWGAGWDVSDQAGNLIRTFGAAPQGIVINDVMADASTLTFDGRGFLSGLAGGTIITICDDGGNPKGRQLTISPTGRAQLDRQFNGC